MKALTQLVDYVNSIAAGNEAVARSAGVDIKAASTPITSLDQVHNLSVSTADDEGELDIHWDGLANAASYEIEISPDPITATSWRHLDTIKPSIYKAKNLTSGSRYWFRVRAIGSRDVKGAWSDPAVKMAT